MACGTRAVLAAAFGAGAERELAAGLTGALRRGMLLLADRGFFSRVCGARPPGPALTCSGE